MSAKHAAEQLTEDQVRAIWQLHQIGGWKHRQLAAMFGTSIGSVSKIVTGRTWRHITGGHSVSRYGVESEYRDAHIAARLAQGVSSYTRIGRELGISRQAVSQRVRHMERSS
jgi:DNA-directed RNA polymerase specialized sigma24 family protein